jgi:hypothetical protein
MMRPFITAIALLAFTVHLLLGCCAHHAHGEEGLRGHQHNGHSYNHARLPGWLCSNSHHGCDHHGHHNQGHEEDSQPTPHVPCSDPQCVFAEFDQSALSAMDHVQSTPVTVSERLLASQWLGTSLEFAEQEKISPHVRRHVALSHFLN